MFGEGGARGGVGVCVSPIWGFQCRTQLFLRKSAKKTV